MSVPFLLTPTQMRGIRPHFPLSHGIPRVDGAQLHRLLHVRDGADAVGALEHLPRPVERPEPGPNAKGTGGEVKLDQHHRRGDRRRGRGSGLVAEARGAGHQRASFTRIVSASKRLQAAATPPPSLHGASVGQARDESHWVPL